MFWDVIELFKTLIQSEKQTFMNYTVLLINNSNITLKREFHEAYELIDAPQNGNLFIHYYHLLIKLVCEIGNGNLNDQVIIAVCCKAEGFSLNVPVACL